MTAEPNPAVPADPPDRTIGWVRALFTSALVVAVSVALVAYVPNLWLTKVSGMSHGAAVAAATATCFVSLFAIATLLRYLQRRKVV
jgi:hypothetical protein